MAVVPEAEFWRDEVSAGVLVLGVVESIETDQRGRRLVLDVGERYRMWVRFLPYSSLTGQPMLPDGCAVGARVLCEVDVEGIHAAGKTFVTYNLRACRVVRS